LTGRISLSHAGGMNGLLLLGAILVVALVLVLQWWVMR
jgi:hypothetical protein